MADKTRRSLKFRRRVLVGFIALLVGGLGTPVLAGGVCDSVKPADINKVTATPEEIRAFDAALQRWTVCVEGQLQKARQLEPGSNPGSPPPHP